MALTGIQKAYYHQLMSAVNQPAVKKYYVSDGDGDITDVYYADANATASGICIRQRFVYNTVSGNKFISKEHYETATWDISWNI